MKKATITFLSVTISLAVMAQSGDGLFVNPKIDDLRHQLSTTGNDSLRARLMVQLAESFMYTNMDSNFYYSEAALKLATQKGFIQEQIGAMGFKAQGLINIGNLPKAMEISMKAVEMGKSLPARFGSIGPNYDNLGQIYFLIGEYDQALKYWRQELAIGQEDPMSEAFGNWNIANFYEELNRLDSALIYLDRSFETFGRIHYSWYPDVYPVYPHWYNIRAKVFTKQGKTELALKDYHQSLNMSLKNNELLLSSVTCNDLSTFFGSMGQPDSSIYYAEKALEFARRSRFKKGILDAAALLSTLYEPTNPVKALQYLKIKEEQQNSLFGAGNMEAIREMMTQEEVRQRELAAAQKAYQDRLRQYALLGFLGAALLVAFLLYRNNRQKQKTNARLQAQNRELEIEAALERVRARTMAMHKSDELLELVRVLYKEIEPFGVSAFGISIAIFREEENAVEYWFADHLDSNLLQSYKVIGQKHTVFQKIWEAWRNKSPQIKIYLEGKEKWDFDTYQFEETDFRKLPEELKRDILNYKTVCLTYTFSKHGYFEAVDLTVPGEENAKILIRFANVFEQTYTRFLDLQRAEAQAREAQIEAALERVRSRTMGMHQSDELAEVVALIYKEAREFELADWGCNIQIIDGAEKMEFWISAGSHDYLPKPYYFQNTGHKAIQKQLTAFKKKEDYTLHLQGEEKKSYDDFVLEHTDFKYFPEEMKAGIRSEDRVHFTAAFMKYGYIVSVNLASALSPEQFDLLSRFAKVFEQTYTRFLDLQRAEAQVRVAQIEAALERVRASMMAMHRSDELRQVIGTLFSQLQSLGFDAPGSALIIYDKDGAAEHWMTGFSHDTYPQSYKIPYNEHPYFLDLFQAWKDNLPYGEFPFEGPAKLEYTEWALEHSEFKNLPDEFKQEMKNPARIIMADAFNKYGMVEIMTLEPLNPDKISILKRFSKVFEQTYTRFLDIQKAEVQAREAKIEAGLERVRAEIASMRSPGDLQRITPLVWRELTVLEVPFFRCGVFIVDEAAERVHAYLSTPEGAPLGVLHLPFDGAETTRKTVDHWRRSDVYTDFWDRHQFLAWVRSMTEQGFVRESATYQGGDEPPESLALQFVPFTQGMLYVGSPAPLPDEQIDLLQRLADTFAVAYARYEDFIKLEEAKKRVEFTLTELKTTQAQLIQSEKLASLGELTAGIAHEIQNPLNFVNNFAEVSTELVGEMKEELQQGNTEDAVAIAADLEQNLGKIQHHGQRASSIVKSMLQHSRASTGEKEATDLNALVDECIRLSYHGLRAQDREFQAKYVLDLDDQLPEVPVVRQDIGRVLLNLFNNAFYAVNEKRKMNTDRTYKPLVEVSTRQTNTGVEIAVRDNGPGIPETVREKIFQPFFTTKPTGQGTGLGLSLAYDIVVKGHGGTLDMTTRQDEGTTFFIRLPGKPNP